MYQHKCAMRVIFVHWLGSISQLHTDSFGSSVWVELHASASSHNESSNCVAASESGRPAAYMVGPLG